jgi:NPCBM/NEW2 domain
MKRHPFTVLLLLTGFSAIQLAVNPAPAQEKSPLTSSPVMAAAQQRIAAFHAGEKASGSVLRLVYFHAADREPLPRYAERLERVMEDVSRFYQEGMEQRFAVKTAGIPLERENGKLKIHMVRGLHAAAHYHHTSGDETWAEVRKTLTGKIDPAKEHVLILYGLCRREPDGRFVFDAPYYGALSSDQQQGLCHAADCDLLDPKLLTATDQSIVFKEHYYERMEMTVAKFNTWYLGGIAHELGHGLGFPHDNGGPREAPGVALMGGGNLHYREGLWGGTQPAYLSLATALRFAAHPLVTQSDKARWQTADATFENLRATSEKTILHLSGRVRASVPPCAIIATVWPTTARSDHGAETFCTAVADDGNFSLDIIRQISPQSSIKLGCLLANGAESRLSSTLRRNDTGEFLTDELLTDWTVGPAQQAYMRDPAQAARLLSAEALATAPNAEARRRLQLLQAMQDPAPEPIDPTISEAPRLYLSDAAWTSAAVGWGKVVRNRYWFNPNQWEGALLQLNGQVFNKGLYAHADSKFTFPLDGKWKTLTATVGLRDGADLQGSAIFTILGDGKELFRSNLLRAGKTETPRINLTGVHELELRVNGGEGHTHNSWAIWADPLLEK